MTEYDCGVRPIWPITATPPCTNALVRGVQCREYRCEMRPMREMTSMISNVSDEARHKEDKRQNEAYKPRKWNLLDRGGTHPSSFQLHTIHIALLQESDRVLVGGLSGDLVCAKGHIAYEHSAGGASRHGLAVVKLREQNSTHRFKEQEIKHQNVNM